jgi:biopolymer transport protein ExbD
MSASFGNNNNSQEVDLNITPIIDCFTVLITFMLASASFLSIGFFEASTPGTAVAPGSSEPDTEAVLRVKSDHTAELKIKGKKNLTLSFQLANKDSMKALNQEIQKLTTEQLNVGQVLVSADDDVDYKSVADVMGQIQDSKIPAVIGEF